MDFYKEYFGDGSHGGSGVTTLADKFIQLSIFSLDGGDIFPGSFFHAISFCLEHKENGKKQFLFIDRYSITLFWDNRIFSYDGI